MKRINRPTVSKQDGARKIRPILEYLHMKAKQLSTGLAASLSHIFHKVLPAKPVKDRLVHVTSAASRILPALSVVLVLTTLVLYLTLGPGSPEFIAQQSSGAAETTGLATVQQPVFSEFTGPDLADYLEMNRGGYPDYWYQEDPMATSAETADTPATPVADPDPAATPELTPLPTATPVPLETDSSGVVQEPRSISDFTPDDTRIYIKAFEANVRVSPRTDVDILQTMTMGDRLTRTGIGDYWSQVLTESGKMGYVYNSLISEEIIYKPKPTATPTPRPTASPKPTATPKPTASASPTKAPADTSSGLTAAQKQEIVDLAKSFIGVKYVYGGSSPSGFDCSGLTSYIYKTLFDIKLPRSAKDQAYAGVKVSSSNIEIGDIICFDWSSPYGVCDHVGIYIGGGQYVDASYTAGKVRLSTINFSRNPILSIRRIVP